MLAKRKVRGNVRCVNGNGSLALLRIAELAQKLEERARSCPGLYPIKLRSDFIRIALDRLETPTLVEQDALTTLAVPFLDEVCHWLESMHHHPEVSYQINALSLIRRGANGPFAASTEKVAKNSQ